MVSSKVVVTGGAVAAGAHLLPSVGTIPALHKRLLPRLSGVSSRAHIALTFDDGPDPASTPEFLAELSRLGVRATFFLLGTQLAAAPALGRRLVADGHEVAVHGWLHRPHLLRAPWQVHADVLRTYRGIREITGVTPRFWRPPNGVLSGAGIVAARRLGLAPVLWTADGLDWQERATPETALTRIASRLDAGGTVLLHDSDVTSAPRSWRAALGALAGLLELCRGRGWELGPLIEHW